MNIYKLNENGKYAKPFTNRFSWKIFFLKRWSCLYVCERAITELLGNADMLSPVMNIIRWMPVVTLRPDTHTQVYHSLMCCIHTHIQALTCMEWHCWDIQETYKNQSFDDWHQLPLFKEAVCFTSMSLLAHTELLCFSFGRQQPVSELFRIKIRS